MSSWRNEFIASLQVRDRKEKANRGLYRACMFQLIENWFCNGFVADISESDTKLADRAAHQNKSPAQEAITAPSLEHGISAKQGLQPPKALATAIMDKIREDLTDAQCRRGELQAHLTIATEEVERLQLKLKLDNKLVNGLLADKQLLTTKLKDRDEELRGKAKLLEVCFVASHV